MPEQTYLNLLRRFGIVLVIAAVLGAASGYFLSRFITPTYESTTKLLVTQPTGVVGAPADLEGSAQVAAVLGQLVSTQAVLERAAALGTTGLTPSEIARQTQTEVVQLVFLEITGTAETPEQAQLVTQALSDSFIATVNEGVATGPVSLTVIEPAGLPDLPVSPRKTLNAAAGGMLGLVAAAAVVLLYVRLDDVVKDTAQVQEATGLPTLGMLPSLGSSEGPEQLRVAQTSGSRFTEAVRAARANLSVLMGVRQDGAFERKVVLITSVRDGDGAGVTSANLALAFGRAGYRTLLIDCNFRQPRIQALFEIASDAGLGAVLSQGTDPDMVVHGTSYPDIFVLPAGYTKAGSVDALGSVEMRDLVDHFRQEFDVVILLAPPTLEVPDAATLSPMVDLVLLVGWSGRTRGRELQQSIEALERSGGMPVGVILNGAGKEPPSPQGGQPTSRQLSSARLPVEVATTKNTPE